MKIKRKKAPKKPVDPRLFDDAMVTFRAPEYLHHEKSLLWFIIAGIVCTLLVVYGLLTDGWTFSLAVVIFAGTYYSFHLHKPRVVEVKISKIGVKIGTHRYTYQDMKGFWIVYDPPYVNKLYIRLASRFHPDVFISLQNADPVDVRHALCKYIKQLQIRTEPFSDTLVRLLRL